MLAGARYVLGQLAQAEQHDTHLFVLLQLERAPREQRAHAPRLAQRVAVGVVQEHKLCRRHAEHGGVVAVAVDGDVSRSDAVVASRHSRCLRTREHELVSS